jgi:hypothetical protein
MAGCIRVGIRLAFLIALAAATAPAAAQQWSATAQAGRMRSALDPASASSSIALGLGYDAPTGGLRLSTGVPTSSVESLWAGASGWTRAALDFRGFMAGVDLAGNAFLTRDRSSQPVRDIPGPFDPPIGSDAGRSGHAYAGQAMPVIGYEGRRFQMHARAGVSHYGAQFGDQQADRTVRLADLQLTFAPVSSFALIPVIRRFEADAGFAATYAGASAVATSRRGTVWGSVGQWTDVNDVGTQWAAGARVRFHPRVALESGVRHDTFDPLYMQPPQTAWNVGLSVQVGGPVRPLTPPAPPVPAQYADGRATIQLPVAESPAAPSIAGDFNGWKAAPMKRTGDRWAYTIALAPGVYNYAFVRADGTWFVPESVPGRKEDGMGGHVAVLVVEGTSP